MVNPDVIIVGGGVIGCSVAYSLAREGLTVTLFERDHLGAHASGAAAGMLAPICESSGSGPFFEFGVHSLSLFAELVPEVRDLSGVDPQYLPSGILRVAGSEAEAQHLQAQAARLADYGLEWLGPSEAREREPRLTPDLYGALWSPQEGHVYSPLLTRAYAGAAVRLGARVETAAPVLGLIREGNRIYGVKTAAGDQFTGHVVLCAGVWTRFCVDWLGESLPLEPVRGQILSLDAPRPSFRSIVWGAQAYLVPKLNGAIVVGATEEHAGFDCRTTAAGIASLLAAAPQLIPSLADCTFRQAWAGLRPDTPDHLPAIGPIPGVDGLTLAAGHYRNGVLLSPATGQLAVDYVLQRTVPRFASAFLPQRLLLGRG
jgi:glycine oxidase